MKKRWLEKVVTFNDWVKRLYSVIVYDCWIINVIYIIFIIDDILELYESPTQDNRIVLATYPLSIFLSYSFAFLLFGDSRIKKK